VQYFATQPDPTLCHSTKATDHNQDITSKNDQNKDTCHFLVELGLDVSRQRNERFLDVDTGLGTCLKELDIVLGSKLHVTNTQTQSYNDIGQHHMSTVTTLWTVEQKNYMSYIRSNFVKPWPTLCLKKRVAHYNIDADQTIVIIFGRNVAEKVRYKMMICYPTSPN